MIAEQLCGEGMTIDFDQRLAKSPGRADAVFGWHQDQACWHNEGVRQGSGGNTSASSDRRAYIVALRSESTVAAERRRGVTHSHSDAADMLAAVDGLR